MEKKNVPKIRFPGFTEPWEQRKLGEISDKVTEKNINNTYNETFTNSAEYGIIPQRDFFEKDISNIKNLNGYYVVRNDDFVYNPRISNFAPVGPIKRNKLLKTGVMSPLYYVFRTRDIDRTYLEHYFDTTYWHMFMKLNGDSGARSDRFAIKDSVFVEMPIPFPKLEEQKKIGMFFEEFDNLITLHQRKLENLKKQKKGLLQKMFPEKGKKVPEIRFPEFTDAWEQRKFSELYEKNTEKNVNLIGYDKTISIATMTYKDEGNGASEESLKTYKVLRMGDLAFEGHTNKEFRYGRFVANDIGIGIMSPRFSALRPINEMPISFWKYYIHYEPIMRKILVNSTKAGTMMNELVISDFMEQRIQVPSYEEQNKIGGLFDKLDNLISLHQRKLEHLQKQKKALLQQMFV